MGQNDFAALPTAVYGVDLLLAAVAYFILQLAIIDEEGPDSVLAGAMGRDLKGKVSPVLYLVAVPFSFVSPWIGLRLIGETFDGTGSDQEAAQENAFRQVVAEIERAYMARVRVPSATANERFDEITNHGLDPIDEAEAIALTIARQ